MSVNRIFVAVIFLVAYLPSAHAQTLGASGLGDISSEQQASTLIQAPEEAVEESSENAVLPFGANLFTGKFAIDQENGLNPNYKVSEGDQINVRIWGAYEFNDTVTVDAQGNIFIPKVGPIKVVEVYNKDLNQRVYRAVRSVFTDNVQVYTSLIGTQPVAVFVTGHVKNPGRYAGIPSNSILYFIDRAGGIESERGSYRKISVIRARKTIAEADLYSFIRNGEIPKPQFQDGDTIVVAPRGASIDVAGEAQNTSRFEIRGQMITGEDVIELARPLPGVSHVGVSGTRVSKPFAVYVALADFSLMTLRDGDQSNFQADRREETIVVEIEGSHLGPSRYAVPRDTTLHEILDHIPVDPKLTDTHSISLRRQSIVETQRKALEDSLRRLEVRYLTASSHTNEEARIRAQEAQMISDFVKRARQVTPNGRLVVSKNGSTANVSLEPGDIITIPRKTEAVFISGEVLVAQAVLFKPGDKAKDYISRVGGFTDRADPDGIVILRPNGEAVTEPEGRINAGDQIIVLPKVPSKNLQLIATVVDIMYKIAISAAVVLRI